MKINKNFFQAALMMTSIAIAVPMLNGCIAAAVTGGAAAGGVSVAYIMGTLHAEIHNTSVSHVAQASKKALQSLDIRHGQYRVTEVDALITGYTAVNEKIIIKVKRMSNKITQLTIHVGYIGNEETSELIYKEIIKQLKHHQHPSEVTTYAIPETPAPEFEPMPEMEPAPRHIEEPEPVMENHAPPMVEYESAPVEHHQEEEISPDVVPITVTDY